MNENTNPLFYLACHHLRLRSNLQHKKIKKMYDTFIRKCYPFLKIAFAFFNSQL